MTDTIWRMKRDGYTDPEGWRLSTLLHMARDRGCWAFGVNWRAWRCEAIYLWYDGPIWAVQVGPFTVSLSD